MTTKEVEFVVGKPYKSYIKTILGKVFVQSIDPISGSREASLLTGDPYKGDENSIIDTWDEKSDLYFRKSNKRHFELGVLKEFVRKEEVRERTIEEFTDDELREILNSRYLAYKATINKVNTVAVLYRMERLATEMEKSEKIIEVLRKRQAELTALEYSPFIDKENIDETETLEE